MLFIELVLFMLPCAKSAPNLLIGACGKNERGQVDTPLAIRRAKTLT
jgi:hypothetical protein